MAVKVNNYKPMSNVALANAIRNEASDDYRRNVPVATQANIKANLEQMYRYTAGRNEFVPALINKIGMTLVRPYLYTNKFAEFKMGMLSNGDTIEEIQVGRAKAHIYDPTREYGEETLFGIEELDVQTSYHKITRQEFYKVTVNDALLRRAFLNDDSGLWDFVGQLMAAAANGDNADEYAQTVALFPEYYKLGGFFKLNVPDITTPGSTTEDAKAFMKTVRTVADTLDIVPTTHYNAAKMPIITKPEDLILFTTPAAKASMDVDALAALFNADKAEVPARIFLIRDEDVKDIPGFQGILTTKNILILADTLIETREQPNAAGLYSNFFFHHHGVGSMSRFETAILLTTEDGDEIYRTDTPVTGVKALEVYDVETKSVVTQLERGKRYLAVGEAITDGDNSGVRYELFPKSGGSLSPYTRIFQTGGLEISVDEIAENGAARVLTIRQSALDVPEGSAPIFSDTDFAIVGTGISVWPTGIFPDEDKDGLTEVTPDEPTKNGAVVTIPKTNADGVQYKQAGADVAAGAKITITGSTVFTAVAKPGHELASGAVASWTLAP